MNRATTDPEAEASGLSVLPDPAEVLSDLPEVDAEEPDETLDADEFLEGAEDEEEETPPAAPAAPAPAAPAAAPTHQERFAAALDALGADPEAYVASLEEMARNPQAFQQTSEPEPIETEVNRILQADPEFVEAYNLLQSGEPLASRAEELALRQVVRLGYNAAVQQVTLQRQQAAQERLSRSQAERADLDRVRALPRFAGYLTQVADQRGLLQFARQHGIANLEIAAAAYFSEREFQRGRNTQTKARKGAVPTTPAQAAPRRAARSEADPKPPDDVIKEGIGAVADWMIRNTPQQIRKRLGAKGRL